VAVKRARTRRPGDYLNRDALVRAAADIADRDGWSQLTLSQVAKEVDRHVTSMYAHVENLDGLRREVALLALDELSDAVWRAAMGRIKDDALAAMAAVYREFARDHPGRAAAIMTGSYEDDEEMIARGARLAEPIRATFRSYGLNPSQAAVAHRVFSATVTGLVANAAARSDGDAAFADAIRLFVTALAAGWPGRGEARRRPG
jgi:AcrR family transcriptional regulator